MSPLAMHPFCGRVGFGGSPIILLLLTGLFRGPWAKTTTRSRWHFHAPSHQLPIANVCTSRDEPLVGHGVSSQWHLRRFTPIEGSSANRPSPVQPTAHASGPSSSPTPLSPSRGPVPFPSLSFPSPLPLVWRPSLPSTPLHTLFNSPSSFPHLFVILNLTILSPLFNLKTSPL